MQNNMIHDIHQSSERAINTPYNTPCGSPNNNTNQINDNINFKKQAKYRALQAIKQNKLIVQDVDLDNYDDILLNIMSDNIRDIQNYIKYYH
jgi:hypothetical protein